MRKKPENLLHTEESGSTQPAKQNARCGEQSDPQLTSWRQGPTKERPNSNQNPKTYREQT